MSVTTVGMVGIGQLGLPIATQLLSAGFRVVGYRRRDREAFVKLGGIALDNPASVAAQADFILTCLPSEEAQIEVMEGATGLLAAICERHTLIEMGTYATAFKKHIQKLIHERGARVLESEVSGSPPLVLQGKAALFLGGDSSLIEHCQPILNAISPIQFHIGEFGCAVTMKLIANYLVAVHTLAAAEAINLGVRAGYDAAQVVEVIRQSAGGSTMFSIRAPLMARRAFHPAPGPFNTLDKYIHMAGDLVKQLGCAAPLFNAAQPYFLRAIEEGIGEEDISAVIKLIESDSSKGFQ